MTSKETREGEGQGSRRAIVGVLCDIRSMHNVGSMFRTADAVGMERLYLTGYTPLPIDRFGRDRKEMMKTALGAERTVPWSAVSDPVALIGDLKKMGYQIIALESGSGNGVPYDEIRYTNRVALIVGNEVDGIPEEILLLADLVSEIPLLGGKESLNVSVAFGIGVYGVRRP